MKGQNTGIVRKFTTVTGANVAIGHISEVNRLLPLDDIMRYKSGRSSERAQQLACADLMASDMLQTPTNISRDVNGAPFLPLTTSRISISHTFDYMAMIISTQQTVAIDIELTERRVDRIGPRFLVPSELEVAENAYPENPALLVWSIKECLFKIAPVSGVLFKEHLLIDHIRVEDELIWSECRVTHQGFNGSFSVVSRIFDPLIMSYIDRNAK